MKWHVLTYEVTLKLVQKKSEAIRMLLERKKMAQFSAGDVTLLLFKKMISAITKPMVKNIISVRLYKCTNKVT